MERQRAALFHALLSLPQKAISRIHTAAKIGHARQHSKIEQLDTTGMQDEDVDEDENEVRRRMCMLGGRDTRAQGNAG